MKPQVEADPKPGATLIDVATGAMYFLDLQGQLKRMKKELEEYEEEYGEEFEEELEEPSLEPPMNEASGTSQKLLVLKEMSWHDLMRSGILDDPAGVAREQPSPATSIKTTLSSSSTPPSTPTHPVVNPGGTNHTSEGQLSGYWQPVLAWVPSPPILLPEFTSADQDFTFRPISPSPLSWELPTPLQVPARPIPIRPVPRNHSTSTNQEEKE